MTVPSTVWFVNLLPTAVTSSIKLEKLASMLNLKTHFFSCCFYLKIFIFNNSRKPWHSPDSVHSLSSPTDTWGAISQMFIFWPPCWKVPHVCRRFLHDSLYKTQKLKMDYILQFVNLIMRNINYHYYYYCITYKVLHVIKCYINKYDQSEKYRFKMAKYIT